MSSENEKNSGNSGNTGHVASGIKSALGTKVSSQLVNSVNENIIMQRIKEDYLGRIILEYKNIVISVVLVLALGAGGYFAWGAIQSEKKHKQTEEIFAFKEAALKDFTEDKMNWDTFKTRWDELSKKMGDNENMFPLAMAISDYLVMKDKKQEALALSEGLLSHYSQKSASYYYLAHYLSTVYDDLGKNKEAIGLLETLLKSPVKNLESKIYFDLGRLYKNEGAKDKAKANFQYVVDYFGAEDPFVRLAKAYLKGL